MATFTNQPDEGYSEDPLNPTATTAQGISIPIPSSPEDMPEWLTKQLPGMPMAIKKKLATAILDALPTSAIAEIVEALNPRLYIDFIRYLPPEVCLRVLEFLDPTSLINVAKSCRAWYGLALDKKLWRRLYFQEGWGVEQQEIRKWQDRVNHLHSLKVEPPVEPEPEPEPRPSKKRALSVWEGEGMDLEMPDAGRPQKQQPHGLSLESLSVGGLFKSPTWSLKSLNGSAASTEGGDVDMTGQSRGKGIDSTPSPGPDPGPLAPSPLAPLEDPDVISYLETLPSKDPSTSSPSALWYWEPRFNQWQVNWKYLYSLRRRLEANWDHGRFTNFQFPHPDHPEEGHDECIYSIQYTNEHLVSGGRDNMLRVWSMHTRRLIMPPLEAHQGSVLCLQFDADPEEDIIVSGSSDANVILWKFSTGKPIQWLREAHREAVLNVRFDKRILVTCSKDRSIKIFNRRELRYGDLGYPRPNDIVNPVPTNLKRYGYEPDLAQELPPIPPYTMIGALHGHNAAVNAIQICGEQIVSASGDKAIKVWDWPRNRCMRTVPGHNKGIACVHYDGRRIVSGSSDNEVKVFDSTTGLEVASLRGHTHLVRTVQAGFGDLPYSEEEDREAARRIDEDYFRAVEAGAVSETDEERYSRRSKSKRRRGNAGSTRPQDITAYGANLPPGGGGGRYARIISGSYDTSIIIWRRDKEGIWKDAHHLHQDKAVLAAKRSPPARPPRAPAAIPAVPATGAQPGQQQPPPPASGAPPPTAAEPTQLNPEACHRLIDFAVPRGVAVLEQVLAAYPVIVACESYLQSAIDRVSSPYIRNQMRQLVHNTERAQLATFVSTLENGSSASAAGPSTGPTGPAAFIAQGILNPAQQEGQQAAAAEAVGGNASAASNAAQTAPAPHATAAAALAAHQGHAHAHAQGHGADHQAAAHPQHHPHIGADVPPGRVFKLQFDARRIICCSQTSVIVGWDFCNGDPELEAVSRFFSPLS